MPERWERELKKLRDVHVDRQHVEERVALGQRGGPARHGERWLSGVVAAIIAAVAIAIVWQLSPTRGQRSGSSTGIVVVTVGEGGASATMSFDDRVQSGTSGTGHLAEDQELVGVLAHADDVSAYLPVPADTPVEFEVGDNQIVTSLLGWKHDDGEWEMLQMGRALDRDVLSGRTFRSGSFVLQVIGKTAKGSWFDFSFGIEIVAETGSSPTPQPTPTPTPEPEPADGVLVSVFGLGERSDEMPTASFSYGGETRTACTQDFEWTLEDGTKMTGIADAGRRDTIPECTGRAVEVPPGTSIAIQTASATKVSTTRATTQFFEGDVGLVVNAEWPEGEATFIVPLTVAFTDPDLELVVLDCRPEDQVAITGPDTRILPSGSAYIVGNLPGFERGDVVEQMTRKDGGDAGDLAGVWQVVRDGAVVASVDYPELSGTACRGSGIGAP
jgi:hypothetical protein